MASLSYVYHLVEEDRWREGRGEGYLPRTFDADGFIHATKEAHLLLPVANHFYTGLFVARSDVRWWVSEQLILRTRIIGVGT